MLVCSSTATFRFPPFSIHICLTIFFRVQQGRQIASDTSNQNVAASAPSASRLEIYSGLFSAEQESSGRDTETKLDGPLPLVTKRFALSWAQKYRVKDDTGSRGPLGLRLLHASPEPLVDLIFVHGLRGGSAKTWRKGNDPRLFWPRFWLPLEPGFRHVNIHSFGYDSDWASAKASILNIHDFGQSLLEEMRNSPHLRAKDSNVSLRKLCLPNTD